MGWQLKTLLAGIVFAVSVGTGIVGASAHSFKLALVAPMSGASAAIGKHFREGILLATRERDGHQNEESDGHLGGLDVYILPIDGGLGRIQVLAEVKEAVRRQQVQFITGIGYSHTSAVHQLVAGTKTIFIEPNTNSPATGNIESVLKLTARDLKIFRDTFEKAFGYRPSPDAWEGYIIARLIDRVIRDNGEDVADVENLRKALARIQSR